MTGFVDRERATRLLAGAGMDALVLCEPESFHYATGAPMGPAGLFRRAGAGFAVVGRDASLPIGVIIADFNAAQAMSPANRVLTHPIWIETARLPEAGAAAPLGARIEASLRALNRAPDFTRPATFDLARSVAQLKVLLADYGLGRARIGFDLDFIPAADLEMIRASLPDCVIVNGSPVFERLRAVKSAREIELLRQGLAFSEAGMTRLKEGARLGMRQADLITLYREGAREMASAQGVQISTAEYLTVGANAKAADMPLEMGDPVKADMICTVRGYASDMSRNFVLGPPSADQRELHAIAERAFEAGLAQLRPGRKLSQVHDAATQWLAREGIASYRRGHLGHGVGYSVFSEQWPFIAADSEVEIEPGMVLAYEIPLYVEGLASYNLEDQFRITGEGPVSMNRLPRALLVMPGK